VPECSHLLYLDHIQAEGVALFEHACSLDLEGIIAKRKDSRYGVTDKPSGDWVKIKNASYSQAQGRAELFEIRSGKAVPAARL
jgi:ATP-dependent DNA ligase